MARALYIRNAIIHDSVTGGIRRDLASSGGRIVREPARRAHTVDLDGWSVFPALVNPHDHLELNHYPRTKYRERYDNAHQWGEDVNARLGTEPFQTLHAHRLTDRLFIGGLKNLFSGATLVVQHGPPHRPLFARDFPVDVLREYGWAHSLHFSSEAEIVESYRRTPRHHPWFIHLAEGTDAIAASEYARLKALGCVGPNTVLVHGVGMTEADIADARATVRGLITCPTTNRYLLGETVDPAPWGDQIAPGSDSRLTADGDLLAELAQLPEMEGAAARLLNLSDRGHLRPGAHADWIVMREPSLPTRRANLALVVRDGVPRIGDPDLMAHFPHVPTVPAMLDGVAKSVHLALAQRIWRCSRCSIPEPGLKLDEPPRRF